MCVKPFFTLSYLIFFRKIWIFPKCFIRCDGFSVLVATIKHSIFTQLPFGIQREIFITVCCVHCLYFVIHLFNSFGLSECARFLWMYLSVCLCVYVCLPMYASAEHTLHCWTFAVAYKMLKNWNKSVRNMHVLLCSFAHFTKFVQFRISLSVYECWWYSSNACGTKYYTIIIWQNDSWIETFS